MCSMILSVLIVGVGLERMLCPPFTTTTKRRGGIRQAAGKIGKNRKTTVSGEGISSVAVERETGIEPATSSLGSSRSTAELLPRSVGRPYSNLRGAADKPALMACRL